MKCAECESLVQEYFDSELDQPTASAVSVHVQSCSACGSLLEQLTSEQRIYARYDRELELSPALWFRTRAQLQESGPSKLKPFRGSQIGFSRLLSLRFSLAAAAALVALAVFATVAVMKFLNTPGRSSQIVVSAEPPLAPGRGVEKVEGAKGNAAVDRGKGPEIKKSIAVASDTNLARRQPSTTREPKQPMQLVREAEQKYLSAIALLSRDVHQRQSQFDPETREKLDGALAAIDRTISSTRKAVKQNPNDPLAVQYMLAAYGKKVDVLKEMNGY
jgi:hypothetical protein